MSENIESTLPPVGEVPPPPKKKNTGLIIALIVLAVLCCCCIALVAIGWSFWPDIQYYLQYYLGF